MKTKRIKRWVENSNLSNFEKEKILNLSEEELDDCFSKDLEIGTAGIRGIIGLGDNRINKYIIKKIVYFYGLYLLKKYPNDDNISVVIGFDTRLYSYEFSKVASNILNYLGIKTYIFSSFTQTPVVSFTIKKLKLNAGIMITASHNQYNYNGVKLYNNTGGQLNNSESSKFKKLINDDFDYFKDYQFYLKEEIFDKQIYEDYYKNLEKLKYNGLKRKVKIVFTPLHGTSIGVALVIFNRFGFDYCIVDSQNIVDPYFNTVKYPNPETIESFKEAILYADGMEDLIIAFDPDSDRMGVIVNKMKELFHLTGNQVGVILFYFLCLTNFYYLNKDKIENKKVLITTYVSSLLIQKIASFYDTDTIVTLTGFKNINEEIEKINKINKTFVFGFEESCGYLILEEVRDKDAFQAAVLLIQAAEYFKAQNKTLVDVLEEIYKKYGYEIDKQISFNFDNDDKIKKVMEWFRTSFISSNDLNITAYEDLLFSIKRNLINGIIEELNFEKVDVIKFYLNDDYFIIRPSGTESKIKIYIYTYSNNKNDAINKCKNIETKISKIIYGDTDER